jgi:hypothetical protein
MSKYREGKEQKITESYKICEERRRYKRTMKETKKNLKNVNMTVKLLEGKRSKYWGKE